MDRVRALVEKLSEQLRQNEDKASVIITAQQLLTELGGAVVAKPLPQNIYEETANEAPDLPLIPVQNTPEIQPIATMAEINESALEGKNEIPANELIPTPHTEILEAPKLDNNTTALSEIKERKEVKDHLVLEPIKDLRSAIGINDKFQFIQELFGGDEKSFEVGIKTINSFKIFPEAQFYIKREFREKNNWDEESGVVKQFDQLVKRRFL